jgi:hypothetical protein
MILQARSEPVTNTARWIQTDQRGWIQIDQRGLLQLLQQMQHNFVVPTVFGSFSSSGGKLVLD